MELQKSPALTEYSSGGTGVAVAIAVGSSVGDGVMVAVAVVVIVGVTVGVVTRPADCRITKTNAAPKPSTRTTSAIAAGRLIFSSGSLGFCIWVLTAGFMVGVKVRPQTRQRVAFSLNLVPQVGQVFGLGALFSGLIFFLDDHLLFR